MVGVAELPYEQEVHLAHGVAHVLRTEQTLVRAPSRLYRLHLPVNIGKELFQKLLGVHLNKTILIFK